MARPKKDSPTEQTISVPVSEIVGLKEELTRILTHLHTGLLTLQNAAADSIRVANMAPNRVLAGAGVSVSNMGFTPLQSMIPNATMPTFSATPAATAPDVLVVDAKPKKQKREKKIKDPNAPPRPVTAYFLFLKEKRAEIKAELGEGAAPGEVQAKATERWKDLSDKHKDKYKVKYKENWEKYEDAVKKYNAQGGQIPASALAPADVDAIAVGEDSDDDAPPAPVVKKAKEPKKAKPTTPAAASAASAAPKVASPAVTTKSPEKKKKAAAAKDASPEENKKKRKSDAGDKAEKKKKKKTEA